MLDSHSKVSVAEREREMDTWSSMWTIVAIVFFVTLANGQQEGENVSCSVWYHNMPESIVCQENTHFSTACQIDAPCGVEVKAVWYWSPENKSNSTYVINDSADSRVRALTLPTTSCNDSSVSHFYTLTLANLNNKNAGYYWCQLKVADEGATVKNLLPSNKCYVGINNSIHGCEYGDHKEELICAISQELFNDDEHGDETQYYSKKADTKVTVDVSSSATFLPKPTPTLKTQAKSEQARQPQIRMQFTITEVVLLALLLLSVVIIVFLLVCLFWQRRRRKSRSGSASEEIIDKQQLKKSEESLDNCHARYTPVSTLSRTHSLVSDWRKSSKSKNNFSADDPIYSSPYQSLSEVSMDYASMYSKLHQQSPGDDVTTAAKSATPKNSSL